MISFFLDRNYLHLILEIMFWISRSGSSTQQDCKFNTWRDGGMAQAGNRAGKTEPYRWKQMNERKFHGRQWPLVIWMCEKLCLYLSNIVVILTCCWWYTGGELYFFPLHRILQHAEKHTRVCFGRCERLGLWVCTYIYTCICKMHNVHVETSSQFASPAVDHAPAFQGRMGRSTSWRMPCHRCALKSWKFLQDQDAIPGISAKISGVFLFFLCWHVGRVNQHSQFLRGVTKISS